MLISDKPRPAIAPTTATVGGTAPRSPDEEVAAVNLIYHHYAQALYDVIFRIVRTRELAEDIRQECLIKIWSSWDQYDAGRGKLFTWITRIARNVAIDKTRSRAYRKSLKTINLDQAHVFGLAETSGFRPETIGIKELTDLLEPNYKKVIQLLYFEGFTQLEAAQTLNIPLGTVKTRANAAIKRLRRLSKAGADEVYD